MPTIEMLFDDLQRLVGRSLPQEKMALTEILAYVKGEVETLDGNNLTVELKDGNRPDLWCVEGIARGLRGALGVELGLKRYEVSASSGVEVSVDPRLRKIRPYIGCSLVRNVRLNDEVIRELMHLQDKLDQTYGRKRSRASIGLYNFDLIKPPIHYRAAGPEEYSFVPLEGTESMTLRAILKSHPKGVEYGDIVRHHRLWPMLVDDTERVLSFPPIINSNDLGKIVEGEQDIFVEVTGTNSQTVLNTVTLVTLSLADRGKLINSVKVCYPDEGEQVTPNLATKELVLRSEDVNRVLGMEMNSKQVAEMLLRARYGAGLKNGVIRVTIPCYRTDIMHPLDVVEDVLIAYGFNNISPIWPKIATTGGVSHLEELSDTVREIMLGLEFQEILTFSLSTPEIQRDKMGLSSLKVVELANPMTLRFTCLRSWLLPNLLEFLGSNTHATFPQKVFEVGDCVVLDGTKPGGTRDVRKLAGIISHPRANFSEIKGNLEGLFRSLGFSIVLKEIEHPSFIPGRVGIILVDGNEIGILGELSPSVLENWLAANPAAAFEIDLDAVFKYLPAMANV